MFGTRYTLLCAAFIVFGCADIGLDELNNEGLDENQTRQVARRMGSHSPREGWAHHVHRAVSGRPTR